MALDIAAVIPVVGLIKYSDDLIYGVKALFKNGDDVLDGSRKLIKAAANLGDLSKTGRTVWNHMADSLSEMAKNVKKADMLDNARYVDDMVDAVSDTGKRLDDVVEGGKDVLKFNNWNDMKEAYKGTITQFVQENKPKYSPNIKKWFDNGGSIEIQNIDGKQIWTYTSSAGDSVPYIDGYIKFPDDYLNPTVMYVDIGEFTGDRSKDIDKMMDI